MIIGTKARRGVWVKGLLWWGIELALCFLVQRLFNLEAGAFLLIFLGLQGAYFVAWLGKTLASWLFWRTSGKKETVERMISGLHQLKMPEPPDYLNDAPSYFSSVAQDTTATVEQRIGATAAFEGINTLRSFGHYREAFMMTTAWEVAIERYKTDLHSR